MIGEELGDEEEKQLDSSVGERNSDTEPEVEANFLFSKASLTT